jgi:hypothetical protein
MEGMDVVTFQNLLVKIFKSHGFEIDSASNYNKYILATKDNITLSIGYTEPGEDGEISNLRKFFTTAKRDYPDRLIYIIPSSIPMNLDRFANDRNIQLWDRERLERELGRALVTDLESFGDIDQAHGEIDDILKTSHGILSTQRDPDLSSSASAATEETTNDTIDGEIPIMVPTMIFGDDLEKSSTTVNVTTSDSGVVVHDRSGRSQYGSESYGKGKMQGLHGVGVGVDHEHKTEEANIVKPNVSKDLAANMASKIVKGFRFNLELIPYYVFDYSCEFNIQHQNAAKASGILGINALTSNVEDWPSNMDIVNYLEEPHTKLDVKFSFDNALTLIKQAVMERNTKMIETREEYDSTIIFEKKKLKPKPEAIKIESKGLFYLPVWCIEGSNGLMIIDANSGKVIKEDMFKPA